MPTAVVLGEKDVDGVCVYDADVAGVTEVDDVREAVSMGVIEGVVE